VEVEEAGSDADFCFFSDLPARQHSPCARTAGAEAIRQARMRFSTLRASDLRVAAALAPHA
jgi:hypothetical protein